MNWLGDERMVNNLIILLLLFPFFGVPAIAGIVFIIVAAVKELRKK